MNCDPTINMGMIFHLIILVGSIGFFYARIIARIEKTEEKLDSVLRDIHSLKQWAGYSAPPNFKPVRD